MAWDRGGTDPPAFPQKGTAAVQEDPHVSPQKHCASGPRNPRPRRCFRPLSGMTAVIESPVSHVLVSSASIRDLSQQMGPEICRQFVGNYIDMWEGRYQRLVNSLDGGDYPGAMDVVLSIKISSHMAGAERLSTLAAEAQAAVAAYDFPALDSMVEAIGRCGADTMAFLTDSLGPAQQDRF